jgi:hypothetical protein
MSKNSLNNSYAITIKDHLDPCWNEWFEGWTLTNLENGQVLMQKSRVDHGELHGILNKIRDLNLTLISITSTQGFDEEKEK